MRPASALPPSILHAAFAALVLLSAAALVNGCGKELPRPVDTTEGYDRVVLAELFTAVWCGNCGYAEAALDRLFEEEGLPPQAPARLAVLHWHPSFGAGDPFAFEMSDARVSDYANFFTGQMGVPLAVFDGVADIREGSPASYDRYRTRFDLESSVSSPVRIDLAREVDGQQVTVEAQVGGYPGSPGGAGDLFVVIAEHHAINPSPTGADAFSYVARAGKSEAIAVAGSQSITRSFVFTLDPSWKRADLYIVAFLQEPAGASDEDLREVLQAAMIPLFAAEEDFHAFSLTAPSTEVGIDLSAPRFAPFALANTGTLSDTLRIDLPNALRDLPASWSVALTGESNETEFVTPFLLPLDPGSSSHDMRLRVIAPDAGTGTLALTVSSLGDPALSDTLVFHLTAGSYGFELAAAERDLQATVGLPALAPLQLTNSGSLPDSISLAIPLELLDLPSGWLASVVNENDTALALPATIALAADETTNRLRLRVTPDSEGEGTLALVARSLGNPDLADTLRFTIRARLYDLRLSTSQSTVRMVVGSPAVAPLTIENRGSRDDLVTLDIPAALQSLPPDWEIALVYDGATPIALPYWLLVESGSTITRFGLRADAPAGGTATARLVARSTGDPSLADTLAVTFIADQSGVQIASLAGETIDVEPDVPLLSTMRITNSGTQNDLFIVDAPADLRVVPAGWELYWADASGEALSLPRLVPLDADAHTDEVRLHALATGDGTGTIGLVAASTNSPGLADTLIITVRAQSSQYRFDLTAPETEIAIAVGEFGFAPFEITNTGALEDVLELRVVSLENPHPWEIPILCQGGTCYGPGPLEVPVQPDEVVSDYYVDMHATTAATVRVRLTATSMNNPSFSRSIVFTFTATAKKAALSAAGAEGHRSGAMGRSAREVGGSRDRSHQD